MILPFARHAELVMASRPRVDPAFLHSDLTDLIIAAFYRVYDALGFGFLESVYKNALAKALRDLGAPFEREVPIDVYFEGVLVGHYRADFVVDHKVIIEVKTTLAVGEADLKQLLNYLRGTRIELGMLLNFGSKPQIARRLYTNDRKNQS